MARQPAFRWAPLLAHPALFPVELTPARPCWPRAGPRKPVQLPGAPGGPAGEAVGIAATGFERGAWHAPARRTDRNALPEMAPGTAADLTRRSGNASM